MGDKEDDEKKKKEEADAAAASGGETEGEIAPDAQETIAKLTRDLQEEKAGRMRAEAIASKKSSEASDAAGAVQDANLQLVTTAIETVVAAQSELKIRYREALANQDYDSASDINSEIATNAARLVQLESGREAMEAEKAAPRPRPAATPVGDPVEALASTLTPRSATWVRAHPEFVKDLRLNRKMIRAHEDALDDGCEPDSDEYFKYVEARLGVKPTAAAASPGAGGSDALSGAAGGKQRSGADGDKAPPALPPSKSNGGGGNTIRLTPEQKEIASSMGMTEEEYRDNLQILKKEGRITH